MEKEEKELYEDLTKLGLTDEHIKKLEKLISKFGEILNEFYTSDGLPVFIGLRAAGAFLGNVLHRLPTNDKLYFMAAMLEIFSAAEDIMEHRKKEEEEEVEEKH